jgi:hypothetical protein
VHLFSRPATALGLVLLALGLAVPAALAADEARQRSPLSGWSSLALEGRKFLVAKGRSEIRRWDAAGPEALAREVAVLSDAWVFGARVAEHRALSTIDQDHRRSCGWVAWSPREKLRVAELTEGTLTVTDYRGPKEDDGPAEGWALDRERTAEVPASLDDADGGPARGPWDVYALLTRLGPFARGEEPMRVRMLIKRGAVLAEVRRVGRRTFRERVKDLDTDERRRLELPVVELKLEPAGDAKGEEHMLKMRGPVTMWVDPVSGALVRIEGEHAGADRRIELTLDEFALEPRSRPSPPRLDGDADHP